METYAESERGGYCDTFALCLFATAMINVALIPAVFFVLMLIGGIAWGFVLIIGSPIIVAAATLLYIWIGHWLHTRLVSEKHPGITKRRCVVMSVASGFISLATMVAFLVVVID